MPKITILKTGQCKITIPLELAMAKGWNKKGTILRFIEDVEGNVILKKLKWH